MEIENTGASTTVETTTTTATPTVDTNVTDTLTTSTENGGTGSEGTSTADTWKAEDGFHKHPSWIERENKHREELQNAERAFKERYGILNDDSEKGESEEETDEVDSDEEALSTSATDSDYPFSFLNEVGEDQRYKFPEKVKDISEMAEHIYKGFFHNMRLKNDVETKAEVASRRAEVQKMDGALNSAYEQMGKDFNGDAEAKTAFNAYLKEAKGDEKKLPAESIPFLYKTFAKNYQRKDPTKANETNKTVSDRVGGGSSGNGNPNTGKSSKQISGTGFGDLVLNGI